MIRMLMACSGVSHRILRAHGARLGHGANLSLSTKWQPKFSSHIPLDIPATHLYGVGVTSTAHFLYVKSYLERPSSSITSGIHNTN